jgi:hypothetical protein
VSDAWMPGAARFRAASDGGALRGGAPRTVWQALGADPRVVTARSAAQRMDQHAKASHLVWNPLDGEIVQLIPITRAGRSLGWPEGPDQLPLTSPQRSGQVSPPPAPPEGRLSEINAEGRLCVQICVVAYAWEPFTSGPMAGLQEILDWLDSWGMPRTWPSGRPAPFPHGHATFGNRRLWARGGHFGASQVPEWSAAGPGAVDIEQLTGWRPSAVGSGPGPRKGRPGVPSAPLAERQVTANLTDLSEIFDNEAAAASSLTRVG